MSNPVSNLNNYVSIPLNGLVLFINAEDGQLYVKDSQGGVYLFSDVYGGGGGGGAWGSITGNIYAQTDLQEEFDTKTDILQESITCNVSTGVGGIALNQTFASGTSFTDFVNSLIVTSNSATLNITVSGSSAVYSVNQSSTTTNVTVFGTYASGTDGALSNYNIVRTTNGTGVEIFTNSTPPIIPPAGTSVPLGRGVTGFITLQAFAVNATATRSSNTRAFSVIFPYYAGYLTPTSGNTAPTTAQIATFINTGSVSGYTGALVNNATLSTVFANVAINFSSSSSTPDGFLFVCLPQITLNSSNIVATTPAKTSWFDTAQPAITEPIGGGTGLFPNARATQSITSSGGTFTTNYDVYISGYQSKSSPITFKN